MTDQDFLIKKCFYEYDKFNLTFKKYIENKNIVLNKDTLEINFIDFNKKFNYSILGIFEEDSNTWIWAWAMFDYAYKEIYMSKRILDYGISFNLILFKLYLVNSRIKFLNELQLQFMLGFILLILNKKNEGFIYIRQKKNIKEFFYISDI